MARTSERAVREMDEALAQLANGEMALRKKGLRRLSDRARMNLMNRDADTIGEWFMQHREALFAAIRTERDADIQAELVFTLQQVCERFALLNQRVQNRPPREDYLAAARAFTDELYPPGNARLAATLAGALATLGDNRAWDLYAEALERYRDYLTVARFEVNWAHYGDAASPAQRQRLHAALRAICEKTKSSQVLSAAKRALQAKALLEQQEPH